MCSMYLFLAFGALFYVVIRILEVDIMGSSGYFEKKWSFFSFHAGSDGFCR